MTEKNMGMLQKWHSVNKDSKERVKILYSFTVLLYDKDKNIVEMQISSDDDFKALKEKCSKSTDKKINLHPKNPGKIFQHLVLPTNIKSIV